MTGNLRAPCEASLWVSANALDDRSQRQRSQLSMPMEAVQMSLLSQEER